MFGIDDLAVGAATGIFGGLLNLSGTRDTNAASSHEAQLNRDFQAYQSGTQYQRGVEDLRKAGLNPILAATGGMSAGAAGGSQATMQNPQMGASVSTAVQAAQASAALRSQEAEIKQSLSSAGASEATATLAREQARKTALEQGNVGAAGALLRAQKASAEAQARLSELTGDTKLLESFANKYGVSLADNVGSSPTATRSRFGSLLSRGWDKFTSMPPLY